MSPSHMLLFMQVISLRRQEELGPRKDVGQVLRKEPAEGGLWTPLVPCEAIVAQDFIRARAGQIAQSSSISA